MPLDPFNGPSELQPAWDDFAARHTKNETIVTNITEANLLNALLSPDTKLQIFYEN